ncbi:hypothetical protein MS3_00004729 [Schistosoma haematobium]|uniref:Uncharacterized protein n=1 Tax=Schistosoma haematobium TaxID=6185 RepID=A0A922LDY0_SCHHA|nr:uncharacterized protein MS3_00004729 [Schistosoma haematobium]KAH9578553.1 hypothetical protein MS3_00004729 [Schistosoma haematobium]
MHKVASEFAVSNGILKVVDGNPSLLSCTLLPSPVPKVLLCRAQSIQCDFNLLYHRVAMNHEFLYDVLKPVLAVDPYLRSLWGIYSRIRTNEITQDTGLGFMYVEVFCCRGCCCTVYFHLNLLLCMRKKSQDMYEF